ncbi:cation efflux family protein [Colletotrichum scovillei]|uniref:Cation efflux family protein n=1 Tax=Colletotrichum scovillei TaxID=1209932 RepID=A0A9P7R9C4_9PEZI|nr:cation efflux family protein [Colletotrichum scovillei]KAG7070720.1 cation efflux family protein [Colletotrichum scovillei]KAG7079024.1 cation efflux family protein [Colletotrichum scovillei]
MTMAVTVMSVGNGLCSRSRVEEEVSMEGDQAAPAHEQTTAQKHAGDTQRSQTLNLAETSGECFGRGFQAPRNSGQCQDVGCQVGQTVPGISNHGLGAECVATGALCKGHAEVGVETDASDAHAGVILVGRGQVDIVVAVVVMVVMAVALARLRRVGGHGGSGGGRHDDSCW